MVLRTRKAMRGSWARQRERRDARTNEAVFRQYRSVRRMTGASFNGTEVHRQTRVRLLGMALLNG